VGSIKAIGPTNNRMSQSAAAIAGSVEEQHAATKEIAGNIHQAAESTTQVAGNISDVDRGAAETGSASGQVLSAAQMLSRDSNRLKVEVERFLSTVRAA
jgi:methyl-accepting chemotaxis protein